MDIWACWVLARHAPNLPEELCSVSFVRVELDDITFLLGIKICLVGWWVIYGYLGLLMLTGNQTNQLRTIVFVMDKSLFASCLWFIHMCEALLNRLFASMLYDYIL